MNLLFINSIIQEDWHNYGALARQIYTTPLSEIGGKISYKALVDISYALIKNYPSYFGTKYQLFVDKGTAILPIHPVTSGGTSTDFWYHERNNHFGSTYEVANGINFLDGVHNPNQSDVNGADTFSIAEYIIRTVVMRIAEYVSQSNVNAVCNWTHKEESLGAS